MEEKKKRGRFLLVKRPFTRVSAVGSGGENDPSSLNNGLMRPTTDTVLRTIITQEEMSRQLDPLGHLIYNKEYYPDIWRFDEETNRYYIEEVPRYAFAFQQIILTKQLTHLCGNDIVFELADDMDDAESREILNTFKRGWNQKDMEIAWYELARSVKATGDGAIVGYMDDGEFGWKTLTFLNGDTLYPHYNKMTGKLELFARAYTSYDDNGDIHSYIDVWDKKYFFRLVDGGTDSVVENGEEPDRNEVAIPADSVLTSFDLAGYVVEECTPHRFDFIPVAYHREDTGACWSMSQEAIDNYEMAFSRLAQSNHDFGLPIMYVKGEGSEELSSQDMSYASKVITLPSDGEAGFLNRQDASNAYNAELKMIEDQIYRQSFAVRTPELKSGDTPGVAIKMLYSDAVEKAINDAQVYQHALSDIVNIFKFGYGVEAKSRLDFQNTQITFYIQPYIHINETERATILATGVQNGFCSKQTAAEKFTLSTPQEWDRILREKHEEDMSKLLLQEQTITMQNEQQVELQEELTDIQTDAQVEVIKAQQQEDDDKENNGNKKVSVRKGNVATGRGRGRPRTVNTDKWGNRENENNWSHYNATH